LLKSVINKKGVKRTLNEIQLLILHFFLQTARQ
jgi:hypothetical protein